MAGIYPLITSVRDGWHANKECSLPMGISLYVTQGIFLLLASRNPSVNRGVITFAAWVEYRSCGRHDSYVNPPSERRPRSARRLSRVRRHRCDADCATPSKTIFEERATIDRASISHCGNKTGCRLTLRRRSYVSILIQARFRYRSPASAPME